MPGSGVTGVYWSADREKWRARIRVNYKFINLGSFDRIVDAARARYEAEIKYLGKAKPGWHSAEKYLIERKLIKE